MIKFFKVNDPYRFFWLTLGLIIGRMVWFNDIDQQYPPVIRWMLLGEAQASGLLLYREIFDHTAPGSAGVYALMHVLFGRAVGPHHTMAFILVLVHAGILNTIILQHKVFTANTYVPAFAYVLGTLALPESAVLSPQLMGLTFILLATRYLARRMQRETADHVFLFSGLHLGLATLFYLPFVLFVLLFVASFLSMTAADLRRVALLVYGWALIQGVLLLVLSFTGQLEYWRVSIVHQINWQFSFEVFSPYWLIFGGPLFIFIWALIHLHLTNSVSQLMKMKQFFLLYLTMILLIYLGTGWQASIGLVLLLPPFAFYVSYLLMVERRKKIWRWLVPNSLVVVLIGYPFLSNSWARHPERQVTDWQVTSDTTRLILGPWQNEDMHYQLLVPFLNESCARQRIDDLAYYQSAVIWRDLLLESSPDEIRDQVNMMPRLQYRFPEMAENYVRYTDGIYRRRN